jgi:hypothetical protein
LYCEDFFMPAKESARFQEGNFTSLGFWTFGLRRLSYRPV